MPSIVTDNVMRRSRRRMDSGPYTVTDNVMRRSRRRMDSGPSTVTDNVMRRSRGRMDSGHLTPSQTRRSLLSDQKASHRIASKFLMNCSRDTFVCFKKSAYKCS